MPVDGVRPDLWQFRFRQCAARDRNLRGLVDPARLTGGTERSEEGVGAGADQIVEDEVRPLIDDRRNDLVDLGIPDREIALGEHGAAARYQRLAEDAVVLPGPDVVGADAEGARA